MKTVLVTGSDGFIGRHLVDHLAQAGWRVMGVVRRGSGSPALSAIWPDLKSAGEALQKNRVDVVVHCAGLAHADAQAAVPHAFVNPAPLSQTLTLIKFLFITLAIVTLHFSGNIL